MLAGGAWGTESTPVVDGAGGALSSRWKRLEATTAAVPAAAAGTATLAAFLPAAQAIRAFRNVQAAEPAVEAALAARCFLLLLRRMEREAMPFGYPAHNGANRT